MEKPRNTTSKIGKKRKITTKVTASLPKTLKLDDPNQLKIIEKKIRAPVQKLTDLSEIKKNDESGNQFPILKNEDLVKKFLSVPMTNNQKGRIRQMLKDNLKGTSDSLLPDVINHRIQLIIKNPDLTDSDLRKLRILYNMLQTAVKQQKVVKKKPQASKNKAELEKTEGTKVIDTLLTKDKKQEVKKIKIDDIKKGSNVEGNIDKEDSGKKAKVQNKPKGPKRYVVFLGNLPLGVDKEKIMSHFSEMSDHIKDVRIPKISEEKKSAIAYVELGNEPAFELALSKHHSMLGNRRIKVLYTAQKKGKISKATAKSKSAKLLALQKSGALIGSTPMNRRRSQRRKKMRAARAKEQHA